MSCNCLPQRRACVRRAARALDAHDRVVATDVLAPDTDPTNEWAVEVTLRGTDGVPALVLRTLADHGLSLRRASPRTPDAMQVIATA